MAVVTFRGVEVTNDEGRVRIDVSKGIMHTGELSATPPDHVTLDYDELIDHPIEIGTFKRLEFLACGVKHEVVLTGDCFFDEQRVIDDLTRICEYQINFFGAPAPVDHYVFMVMVVDAGYGGLEHRASTALMITRENLPVCGEEKISDKYLDFLGLCSHDT